MGGRGSLSPNSNIMYDLKSIAREVHNNDIKIYGLKTIKRKGLSAVVTSIQTFLDLQKAHGKTIDSIVIGVNKDSDFSFHEDYKIFHPKTKQLVGAYGRTLIIPKNTAKYSGKSLEKELTLINKATKKEHKVNFVVANNLKQMLYHEYGHSLQHALKTYDYDTWSEFNRRFARLKANPSSKSNLSHYSNIKTYKKRSGSEEYFAEAMTHILRNTKSRKGQDAIDLVWDFASRIPSTNFSYYGVRKSPNVVTRRQGRVPTIKRRPKNK